MENPLAVFHDGEELVRMLERIAAHEVRPPCLLLLDLRMPLRDGFDVLQWLQARPEFRTLLVAVITSSTRDSDRERVSEMGGAEFMEKFPSADDLARLVSRASNPPFDERATNDNSTATPI